VMLCFFFYRATCLALPKSMEHPHKKRDRRLSDRNLISQSCPAKALPRPSAVVSSRHNSKSCMDLVTKQQLVKIDNAQSTSRHILDITIIKYFAMSFEKLFALSSKLLILPAQALSFSFTSSQLLTQPTDCLDLLLQILG